MQGLDPEVYWEHLGKINPTVLETQIALAIFAVEYIECDSRVITSYLPFKNNYGL